MALKLRSLLERALYLSSLADREFSPVEPDGAQINAAADIFSDVMSQFEQQIPYNTEKVLNGEAELLNINAASINFVDYLLGNVPVNLFPMNQEEFSRVARLIDLRAIPQYYWHDKANNALRVYPLPQLSTDKFIIGYRPLVIENRLDDVLPTSITNFMYKFLVYQVASDLCNEYNLPWTPQKEAAKGLAYEQLLNNSQLKPSTPWKPRLTSSGPPVPWLAYLSGNLPGG